MDYFVGSFGCCIRGFELITSRSSGSSDNHWARQLCYSPSWCVRLYKWRHFWWNNVELIVLSSYTAKPFSAELSRPNFSRPNFATNFLGEIDCSSAVVGGLAADAESGGKLIHLTRMWHQKVLHSGCCGWQHNYYSQQRQTGRANEQSTSLKCLWWRCMRIGQVVNKDVVVPLDPFNSSLLDRISRNEICRVITTVDYRD